MTYIEPTPPGTPQPEIPPEPTPQPELDPSDTPDELPPMEPGGGDEGDSRPYGQGRNNPKNGDLRGTVTEAQGSSSTSATAT